MNHTSHWKSVRVFSSNKQQNMHTRYISNKTACVS